LTNNLLHSIPDTIGNLTALKGLWLVMNPLPSLPESIGNLTSLEFLCLDESFLSPLPETLKRWLETLNKKECTIKFI
jgi:Leucine-rich repeat (LRR) protein